MKWRGCRPNDDAFANARAANLRRSRDRPALQECAYSGVANADAQFQLEQFLAARFREFCEALNQPVLASGLRIAPPLAFDEAEYFLLGLDEHLFELDRYGRAESPLIRQRPGESLRAEAVGQLFACDPPRLLRESITQLATAAILVLQRGWQRRQIAMHAINDESGAANYGVEIVVLSMSGDLFAGVELKRTAPELTKLARDLAQCGRRGRHSFAECGFPQNHAKYEFCITCKPRYLWSVAPGAQICFELEYLDGGRLELQELATLPARSMIELSAHRG